MSNETKCNIKEPHSHLVHGKTFECEKGQPSELKKCKKCMGIGIFECEHNTPQRQPQPSVSLTGDTLATDLPFNVSNKVSVREKAREMFDKEFGYKSLDFHDDYDGDGWNGASMVKSTGCDDCARCQNAREAHKNFIDQIITLAQDEKIKLVEEYFDGLIAIPHPELTKENLLKILKQ